MRNPWSLPVHEIHVALLTVAAALCLSWLAGCSMETVRRITPPAAAIGCAALCTETYREQRRAFLHAMSAHKITTYVVSQNSNAEGPKRLADEAYRQIIREIREDALEVGMEHVWLGSPSEPWAWNTGRGRRRAQIAREEWPGTFVLPDAGANRATGRPYFPGIAYDYLEVHPCTIDAAFAALRHPGPILTVTDCTPVLVPGEPALSDLTREAVRLERPLIFYDFRGVQPDLSAIAAVGEAIRGE